MGVTWRGFVAVCVLICVQFAVAGDTTTTEPAVIPKPVSLRVDAGQFRLGSAVAVMADVSSMPEAKLLADALPVAKQSAPRLRETSDTARIEGSINLRLDPSTSDSLGEEGYRLTVGSTGIEIVAFRPAGLFYAAQTLLQLIPTDGSSREIPCVTIEDRPRFSWRGHMLDVARHFFSVADIKHVLDLMAAQKLNRFHWHLTDDQGWRIEIKRYPKLTEVGGWRNDRRTGKRVGGFYTQNEIREVVQYAAERHIMVIPEIEMPGHATAALAAYPELGCTGGPYKVMNDWGISHDVYCAGNDRTLEFQRNILDEVIQLFPAPYIHVGGDECVKDRWTSCTKCQARIHSLGLKDEKELQSWFTHRIDEYLTQHGRRLTGWDEIIEGGLAPGAVVQSWQNMKAGAQAAEEGHDVIMSPTSHCYFDYGYRKLPLETVYKFEPIPPTLPADKTSKILGIEGNVWTELIPDMARYEFQTYPRLSAIAEIAWSPKEGRSWEDFSRRLDAFNSRLRARGVNPGNADEINTSTAVMIGTWNSDKLKEKGPNVDLEWDVTEQAGDVRALEVFFVYLTGGGFFQIDFVSLVHNGREISRDTHDSRMGNWDNSNTVFRVRRESGSSSGKYIIRANARPMGPKATMVGEVYIRAHP